MSPSIDKCILVEVSCMCEYHLKGNCFHPEKVSRGTIANTCDVHSCNHCTNKAWQTTMINKEINYHQTLLNLARQHQGENRETTKLITTQIETNTENAMKEENRFKSPFKNFLSKKQESKI